MKTKKSKQTDQQKMINRLRCIRDNINEEIKEMDHQQLVKYFNNKKTLHDESKWK